ncbi:tRNA (guanosine(46)-N7)-methyltransferase TrmB [Exiguobacterium antarcticum]|uniref:tRNA (guanine-N(7)-)-methyltransferase n=1 Tax=Exiguobacterium antarcticum TaxID=132920 RepID=A0ABT6QXK0_9BACL|nr:tRNA (guanosine(46)-N7)-methyltransferase TrmB [Exiguobacterium antarcticum]AFS71209.1 tRNA (guanine-N(7)-)-methyltransferase [Exiguobacterium antarcticum B7]MDI3233421.1 tRNA (guanosine(46)-N7)-methyltransferase TrmB [Exiguobacterium antarcticum]
MRLRHKPWALDYMKEQSSIYIADPSTLKGNWSSEFKNTNPIFIEVGSGKGAFITGMAKQYPDVNFIAIELFESVAVAIVQKMVEEPLENVRVLTVDAKDLRDFFKKGEVARVYLNFSDPWPKSRHAKRRLTYKTFLATYEEILPKNGQIHFKTDNRKLFESSLMTMSAYGMTFDWMSLDLHANEPENNVRTEYEERFSALGQPIYRMEATYTN